MTLTTSVAILSLLQRVRAEDAAFSPLALSQRNRRLVQNPPATNTAYGGDSAKDEVVVRRPVNVLMRRGRPRWGSKELERGLSSQYTRGTRMDRVPIGKGLSSGHQWPRLMDRGTHLLG
jgi:hypothetical protein